MSSYVHVAVAVIRDSDGKILLTKRPDHVHQGGLWEFPGGKVEQNETVERALVRELREELGIVATRFQPLISIRHHYPDKSVLLDVWEINTYSGQPSGVEGQPIEWVDATQLDLNSTETSLYPLPKANIGIVKALKIPDKMAITGNFTNEIGFAEKVEKAIEAGATILQCRLPKVENKVAEKYLNIAQSLCDKHSVLLVVNKHFNPELEIHSDGLHLTSEQLMRSNSRSDFNCLYVGASCHTKEQIKKAESLELDYITLSPICITATHSEERPLGWEVFEDWVKGCNMPVFALGGIRLEDINKVKNLGGQGVAGISAFW